MWAAIDPANHHCRPRSVGVVDAWQAYDPGMGRYPARVALAARNPANHRPESGVGVSTPCGAVSTRIEHRSCWRFVRVDVWKISDPRMEPYPPRVRRNSTDPIQSAINPVGLQFPRRAGRY